MSAHASDDELFDEQLEKNTTFNLDCRRDSYTGFEFGDFGFMTTDSDQLLRGHTQLILILFNIKYNIMYYILHYIQMA